VEEHIIEEIKRYVGFDGADGERLRAMGPRVAPHAEAVSGEFYARIVAHPGASRSITGGDAQVFALRHTLTGWIRELFEGPWDLAWYERRARIGRRHVEIDLPQQYMFTAMNTIRGALTRIISHSAESHEDACLDVLALDRLLDIELAVMLHTYREDSLARLQRTERLATVGQFAASIAHELRNPLGVIESSAFLVRKRLADVPPAVARHLEKIDAQVRLSNRIIVSVLDLVRDRSAAPRDVQAADLVASALETIPRPSAPPVERYDEGLPEVRVDPGGGIRHPMARTAHDHFAYEIAIWRSATAGRLTAHEPVAGASPSRRWTTPRSLQGGPRPPMGKLAEALVFQHNGVEPRGSSAGVLGGAWGDGPGAA